MRWLSILAAVLLAGGCATLSGGKNEGVDAVHVFGLPVTINMDTRPGPDGFAVRVFVTKNGGAKGTVINNGSIEILMFDGAMKLEDLATQQPKESWKFNPKQLAAMREQTSLGTAYRFTLRWTEPPTHGHVTALARYVPQKGEPIYSSPSSINSAIK
jgi:hypothetical protein